MIVAARIRLLIVAGLVPFFFAGPIVSAATCGINCRMHAGVWTVVRSNDHQGSEHECCRKAPDQSEAEAVPVHGDEGGCCDICQYCCTVHAQIHDAGSDRIADVLANDLLSIFVPAVVSTDATDDLVKPPLR